MTSNYGASELPDQTEVYDEADQASMIQLNEVEKAMAEIRAKAAPESHPDFDGVHCLDCDDEIPQIRLDMGKIRCVYCQSALETTSKLYAKKTD